VQYFVLNRMGVVSRQRSAISKAGAFFAEGQWLTADGSHPEIVDFWMGNL
jgi:hypothetical protein